MKGTIGLIVIAGISITMTACEKVFGVKPSKSVTTETRTVSGFNSIDISDALDVTISYSPGTEACTVKANSNLQEYILTEVKSGTLYIHRKDKVKILPGETIHIDVTVSQLNDLRLSGASTVNCGNELGGEMLIIHLSGASELKGNLGVSSLGLDASGASELRLAGSVSTATIALSGASELEDFSFDMDTLDIDLSGASEASLTVNQLLNVKASGASTLKYSGNGVLGNFDVSGASTVTKQ